MTREENIFNAAKSAGLRDAERARIRTRLEAFVNEHLAIVPSPYGNLFLIFMHRSVMIPLSLLLIVALSGGTAFAAEKALPGDTLYSIKININERVETALAASDLDRAAVVAHHALTRIAEVRLLAAKGRLDDVTASKADATLAKNVTEHAAVVEKLTAEGDFAAAGDATLALETAFDTEYQKLVAEEKTQKSQEKGEAALSFIAKAVRTYSNATSDQRIVAESRQLAVEGKDRERIAAERARDNAESGLLAFSSTGSAAKASIPPESSRMMTLFALPAEGKDSSASASQDTSLKGDAMVSATGTVSADAQARLEEARQFLVEGKARLDAEAYTDAFVFFKKAARATADARLLLRVANESQQESQKGDSGTSTSSSSPQSVPPSKGDAPTRIDGSVKGTIDLGL